MIITRSPLRISLGGGGTDMPSYYLEHEGFLIAAAIDKYVYITLHNTFNPGIILKYSETEKVSSVDEIRHAIIRESMKLLEIKESGIELASMADVPVGTGMGSSGSFTCALLKALHVHKNDVVQQKELAEEACKVEIERVKAPVGKQDQYVSAFGGINAYTFKKDNTVEVVPLKVSDETIYNLEDNLLLFFTGYTRAAVNILKDQDERSKKKDQSIIDNLHFVKELGHKSKKELESGNLEEFADLMKVHWQYKKERSDSISNGSIDKWYDIAMKNGALGGKLLGAGGGGFLMFYADDNAKLRKAMSQEGLKEVRFSFDFEGSRVVSQS